MTTDLPYELKTLSGKAAVFVRGILTYLDNDRVDIPLRRAQEMGMAAVEELGSTISVPYISKLTKVLETLGVVDKERKGKGYAINRGKAYDRYARVIFNSEYGQVIEGEASADDIRMRSAMLDHMTDIGSVRIEADHPLDKVAYQVLVEKFKQGKYDMVFVQRDVVLRMEDEHNELGYHVETLRSSVANQK